MRGTLTTAICMMAVLSVISCRKIENTTVEPKMEMTLSSVSSTGVSVDVALSEGAVAYRMKVVPSSSFDSKAMETELSAGAGYTSETRRIERLHSCKDFVIAARPFDGEGRIGAMVFEKFTLGDFSLDMTLYSPGDDANAELNRYNTLNVIAISNGIAAKGRFALALTDQWNLLKDSKGLKAAAEEVFINNSIDMTRQQLEEMADPDPLKRDLMYFNDLTAGTRYTLVVCLEDLDGERYYYSFNGETKPKNP